GVPGVRFALWAPQAASVAVAGDFNEWSERRHPMRLREHAGVWELFIPRVHAGARYAFAVREAGNDACSMIPDPLARALEHAARPAAIVEAGLARAWRDERFMAIRRARRDCAPPTAIYRIEPLVWHAQEAEAAHWRTLGERLPSYVSALDFTHVQIASAGGPSPAWMFAPPPEHGGADDFAAFIESCHEAGLGVIIEWDAPCAFAGLAGEWGALVQNILADSAMHWLESYHLDGLSLGAGHIDGDLLARIHASIAARAPGALLIVEAGEPDADSAQTDAQPLAHVWRNDMMAAALGAQSAPLVGQTAAQLEAALLAVTPQALADFNVPSGAADPLARLRGAYALAWLTPGAKLMHMGAELGQHEWRGGAVDWDILDAPTGMGFLKLVRDLNHTLRNEAPLRLTARVSQQLIWPRVASDGHDNGQARCVAYVRTGEAAAPLLVAQNRTGEPLHVSIDVPVSGFWRELLNTDSRHYGGGDVGNCGGAHAAPRPHGDGTFRLDIVLPQWGAVIFRNDS
ncbi:MAG: alpha amylase C-terminal domain-containing protein, partial [Beijerinckiaceae bacterium]|nr:alpha amylase C-terminal domain-containing protein [Beijerinckiaceae bacterium]